MPDFKHEVALSFAGEQRTYVQQVAAGLDAAGVSNFFDERASVEMWGEDLAVYLERVYRNEARFVVVFVSAEYAEKAWPRREFRSALARAIEEKGAYILPVRFDDTELPGLLPTVGYLSAQELQPIDVVRAIQEKLGHDVVSDEPAQPTRTPRVTPTDFNPFTETRTAVQVISAGLRDRAGQLTAGLSGHTESRDGRFMLRVLRSGETLYSFDMWLDDQWGENTIAFYGRLAGGAFHGESNAHGWIEWDRERSAAVVRLSNASLLPEMGQEYRLTANELVDAVWNEMCEQIERQHR